MSGPSAISGDLATLLVEELPYGLVVFEPVRDASGLMVDVRIAYHNEQAARLLGATGLRFAGQSLSTIGSPRAAPVVIGICDRVLRGGATITEVVPTRVGMLRVSAQPLRDSVVFIARDAHGDVSGAAVEQLRDSLESTSDSVAVLVPVMDERGGIEDFRCTYANDRVLRTFGVLTTRKLLDRPLREAMPGYPERLIDGYRQVMATGVPFVTEYAQETRRGTFTLHIVATRYQDGVIVATRDTTEHTRAQRELARSEERFRSTVEAMTEAVAVLRAMRDEQHQVADFEVTFVNEAAEQLLGVPASAVVGRRSSEVLADAIGLGLFPRVVAVVETGVADSVEMPWGRGGVTGVVEASVVRLDDGVVVVGRDVTERRRHERRVEESERRFHMLAENAGDAVFYGTLDGLLWVSPSVEPLLGWRPDELIGAQALDLVHPDDRERILTARGRYRPGASTRTRIRMLRRDGSSLWVETLARPIPAIDGAEDGLIVSTVWSVQAEVEMQAALTRAEDERRRSEARLNQAARLESLGVMAGGIAHDFNNLLVGVLGNAELALHELPPESPARERIDRITLAAQRAAELTRQLLDYTGSRSGPLDVVDVPALVRETCGLVSSRVPESTDVACNPAVGVPAVRGDRAQLQQVVLNLVVNASDALAGRPGRVRVSVGMVELAGDGRVGVDPAPAELAPGTYVTIAVADDGPGMSPSMLQRVFEPFFTTKPTGRGLGLAVVHGVVRAHQGAVVADSVEGEGTTMTVYLPATTDLPPEEAAPATSEDATAAGSSPLILVVDDDDSVREVSSLVLERAGMRVVGVPDGPQAIAEFGRRPGEFAAVLLDLTMPEMSGDAVLVELRRIRPDVPVVLISGYSDVDVHARIADQSVEGFVKKPFRPATLVDAIRTALA